MTAPLVNAEIEQCLLGAALQDNRVLNVASFLTVDDFAIAAHQAIWSAVMAIREKGEIVTPPGVSAIVASQLEDEGGANYIAQLAGSPMGTLGAAHWAKVLRDLSSKRKLYALAEGMQTRLLSDDEAPAEEMVADFLGLAESVSAKAAPKSRSARDVRTQEVEAMANPLPCYTTGYGCIDRAMGGGMYQRRTYAIAARKKQGKTCLAGDISDRLNHDGIKHLFIACEMGSDQIEHRIMAKHLGVNALAFLDPGYRDKAWFRSKAGSFAVSSPNNALYLDAPGLTLDQLRREVSHAVLAHGVRGFILDYLQLVGGQRKGQSKAEHLDEVSQWIAETCKKRNIFALVLAQINQEGNIRGGEGIRLAFDQVYELKKQENANGAWLEMLDSRYTKWMEIGAETMPALMLETSRGPYFRELGGQQEGQAA